jgi:hypothetical protein
LILPRQEVAQQLQLRLLEEEMVEEEGKTGRKLGDGARAAIRFGANQPNFLKSSTLQKQRWKLPSRRGPAQRTTRMQWRAL